MLLLALAATAACDRDPAGVLPPVEPPLLPQFDTHDAQSVSPQVSAGGAHTCFLRGDSVVECWGSNSHGQAPARISTTPGSFIQLSAGGGHTCALRDDAVVQCWGFNGDDQAPATRSATAGSSFTQVSAGVGHTCALRADGVIECWGLDNFGQAPATKTATGRFTQVSAGELHSCAVRTDGVVECWGDNSSGQAPATKTAAADGVSFIQVSTGFSHSCGLRDDGVVECWGSAGPASPSTKEAAASTFIQVSIGFNHSCALRANGVIECWGQNVLGEAPPTLSAGSGARFIQLSAGKGGNHTCALTLRLQFGNQVRCWGDNEFGQAMSHNLLDFTTVAPTSGLVSDSYTPQASGEADNLVVYSASGACTYEDDVVLFTGVGICTVTATQAGDDNFFSAVVTQRFAINYDFVGFSDPVQGPPAVNHARAGRAVPLQWRLLDGSGAPVTTLGSVTVTVENLEACALGETDDELSETSAGSSGLQNLGDGYYQFNWKSPDSYAGSCKVLNLDLGEAAKRQAYFHFSK